MTMHLVKGMSTTGKRRGKKKFASSEQKQREAELAAEWSQQQKKWASMSKTTAAPPASVYQSPQIPQNRDTLKNARSVDTGITGAVTVKQTQHYTGTKIIGIAQMAKSNAIPVYNPDHIEEVARMRR